MFIFFRISNEIAALRIQIENAFSSHNSGEKIVVLQKCVSKMDKLFHRSEKEYQKHIDKLRQELDLKDKVMQVGTAIREPGKIFAKGPEWALQKPPNITEPYKNLEGAYLMDFPVGLNRTVYVSKCTFPAQSNCTVKPLRYTLECMARFRQYNNYSRKVSNIPSIQLYFLLLINRNY